MKTRLGLVMMLGLALVLPPATLMLAQQAGAGRNGARPEGPCDIYAAARTPCVAAHSTTRALFAAYNGPLYQIVRQSDGKTKDIGVIQPSPGDPGGYADAAAQDDFCANTYCWISIVYDQSGHKNDLIQAPRGGTGSPTAMGGFNSVPVADWAPITIMGHKAYGIFIQPGMGLRNDNPHRTAVDDQAEGQYWVVNGHHYNSGCCFDYGNAEIDSRDDGNGTMETAYFGNATSWFHGPAPGPWIMTDQENNLVGCVNASPNDKNCPGLPIIKWRFVTATADGEPHHWRTMGGDAQTGDLKIQFDGPRVDRSYDPMRKQGAIDLGNGGDNSNSSQGTVYEAAMTEGGTMPSQETNQKLQANIVAAGYGVQRVSVAPTSAVARPPGLQTFAPGSSQDTTVTFTNTSGAPVTGVKLSLIVPTGWTATASEASFASVAPNASVNATFKVTSGPAAFNGDLVGEASWTNAGGQTQSEKMAEKVRNISPIKINEYANNFIELYNASDKEVDISNWTLTEHATQQAIFSSVKIPAGTGIAGKGFYVLGLSDSGLAIPAKKGETVIHVRSVTGMNVGDTIDIDGETRTIATLGTAAGAAGGGGGRGFGGFGGGGNTTVWQPLPEGPVITIPAGSTSVPVASTGGFTVGQKVGLGYGATYPVVAKDLEKYEVVTVTAVGRPGSQTALAAAAQAGDTSIRLRSTASVSVGDKITLDIDSIGHGVEVVTVTGLGGAPGAAPGGPQPPTPGAGVMGPVAEDQSFFVAAPAGGAAGSAPGGRAGGAMGGRGGGMGGMGGMGGRGGGGGVIELAAPLKFNHAANLPVSVWGTGISFEPKSAFAHSSNEPVLPLGTGITLDKPLDNDHDINAAVRDEKVTDAGYQGTPKPNQWFGGPAITNSGAMVLRDAAGRVADSLNFGAHVDPWAGEGYQAGGGSGQSGCRAPSPGGGGFGRGGMGGRGGGMGGAMGGGAPAAGAARSAGRTTDGADTDSNCTDFAGQNATPGAPNQR